MAKQKRYFSPAYQHTGGRVGDRYKKGDVGLFPRDGGGFFVLKIKNKKQAKNADQTWENIRSKTDVKLKGKSFDSKNFMLPTVKEIDKRLRQGGSLARAFKRFGVNMQ